MFKILFHVTLALASAAGAFAQMNPTTELLRARHATRFVRIGLVPDAQGSSKMTLQYGVDDFSDLDPLVDGIVLRTDNGADIYLAHLNPLTQTFVVNAEASADVSYASLKAFLEDVQKAQANLAPAPPATGGSLRTAAGERTACGQLLDHVTALHQALEAKELTPATLTTIVEKATGFRGVQDAANDLRQKKGEIDGNIEKAEKALQALRTEFSSFAGAPPTKDCRAELDSTRAPIMAKTEAQRTPADKQALALLKTVDEAIVKFADLQKQAPDVIAKKQKLSASIDEILKTLAPYLVMSRWRGPIPNDPDTLTDWDFKKITPDFVNQQKVTVTAKAKDIVIEKDVIVVKELDASKQTADFRMRQDSLLIPERAVAVLYNRLKYPKYTVGKNADGKSVVVKSEDEDPWNGALLLNLVMRLRRPSVANPMIQLGVSTAKDYPGLVAGVGLRFTQPIALGLSFGGMITRYKDLDDELQDGSEVASEADIEKHLEYRTSPIVPYVAVQIKF
jgi:hypothetical protein